MFVDRSDEAVMRAAIEAGVSAYVVGGLSRERIRPVLAAAIARFHVVARLRSELAATKAALEERKVVDRAKGMLMKAKGLERGRGLRAAAPHRDGPGQEARRGRRRADHRGGAAEMSQVALDVGFVPLLDASPLVIAHELGFAAEEGLELRLHREPSWSALRDRLLWGSLHAAHMLSPMPVALTAGIGGMRVAVDALLVLSVNGDMIGVRPALAERMAASELDFLDAFAVGRALSPPAAALRIGVPFPISMHVELCTTGSGASAKARASRSALCRRRGWPRRWRTGEIDAFCVGEPWGSVAVEAGAAQLVPPGARLALRAGEGARGSTTGPRPTRKRHRP